MDSTRELQDEEAEEAVANSSRFVNALFDDADRIIVRPVETWNENGRKISRVDFDRTQYPSPVPWSWGVTLPNLLAVANQDCLNLFFGICPRFQGGGAFDLAWQIRTVRCLWTDIDHVDLEQSYERVEKAGLPRPSVVVNSGNGVHLYWRLDTPYLIDDVGDPPPVRTEWTEPTPGLKKPRKYIFEDGDRVYLDQRRHLSRLSPKAEHVQDVLAGLAKLVGGDHTQDLSRLLRIPGSLNRKDQRNGPRQSHLKVGLFGCYQQRIRLSTPDSHCLSSTIAKNGGLGFQRLRPFHARTTTPWRPLFAQEQR